MAVAILPMMSMVPPESGAQPEPSSAEPAHAGATADVTLPRGCPFLIAEGGGWRFDLPAREHRCGAVSPPAPLSPEKQSRLCLTPAHASCATYLASTTARQARLGTTASDRVTRWGLARTTTVIEDSGGLRARLLAALLDRRRWPAIPAVLLVTTLFTLALSGFRGGGSTPAAATASPARSAAAPAETVRPSARPSDTPAPEPSSTLPPPASPSVAPTGTPAPESFRTYRVKSGDTLSAIAAEFGTTSRAIAQLNGITVNSILRIGQVLKIPNS